MKILLINGSPNEKGNTYFLLNQAAEEIQARGGEANMAYLHGALQSCKKAFCNACSSPCNQSCYKSGPLEALYQDLREADGVLIGSPVYFGSATAQVKTFFDKSRFYRAAKAFAYKPCGAVAVGGSKYGGQETTVRAIHDMAMVQGMTVIGDGSMDTDMGHQGACCQRPAQEDEFGIKRARSIGIRIAEMTGR